MNEVTGCTPSDGKRPKKETLTRARPRARLRTRARELVDFGRFPSDAVHPVTQFKTPRAEAKAERRRRRLEVWAWSEASKRSAQRFLVERIVSGPAERTSSCTSTELAEAYAEFCRAESLSQMDRPRLVRLFAAKLPSVHGAAAVRLRGVHYSCGYRGIRIRPLTKAPRNTIADLEAAVNRDGLNIHTRIVEAFYRAAVSLGWVDLTDTPESPSLRDGEDSGGRLNGGNS